MTPASAFLRLEQTNISLISGDDDEEEEEENNDDDDDDDFFIVCYMTTNKISEGLKDDLYRALGSEYY